MSESNWWISGEVSLELLELFDVLVLDSLDSRLYKFSTLQAWKGLNFRLL